MRLENETLYLWTVVDANGKAIGPRNVSVEIPAGGKPKNNVLVLMKENKPTYIKTLSDNIVNVAITKTKDQRVVYASPGAESLIGLQEMHSRGGTIYFECPEDFAESVTEGKFFISPKRDKMFLEIDYDEMPEGLTFVLHGVPTKEGVVLAGGNVKQCEGFVHEKTDKLFVWDSSGVKSLGLGKNTETVVIQKNEYDCFEIPGKKIEVDIEDEDATAVEVDIPKEVFSMPGTVIYYPYGMDGETYFRVVDKPAEEDYDTMAVKRNVMAMQNKLSDLMKDEDACAELYPIVNALINSMPEGTRNNGNDIYKIIKLAASLSGVRKGEL